MRFYSAEEIAVLADRTHMRIEAGRPVHLTPAIGWLIERAARAYAARPTREQIMVIICGKNVCNYSPCMIYMGKANAVMRLWDGTDRR